MSRIIKFRVWATNDKNPNGKMYYPEESPPFLLNLSGNLIEIFPKEIAMEYGMTFARIGNSNINIQQFTGLLDKNGREIYEGDIAKIIDPITKQIKNLEIVYEPSSFYAKNTVNNFKRNLATFDSIYFLEIIGNIYENPELLNN